MEIDRSALLPLYFQLKEALREQIKEGLQSGELSPGDYFTSEKELCKKYDVSNITVKRALNELVNEGLLVRQQGRGTFVARPKIEQGLQSFYSITTSLQEKGIRPSSKVLEVGVTPATKGVARHLDLEGEGQEVVKLVRLRLADEEPFALETSYLPSKLFPDLANYNLSVIPLYDLLSQKYGVEPIKAQEFFEPTLVDQYEAMVLGVKQGSPALLLERITYTLNDRPIELCKGVIRGDRCRLSVELLKREQS